MTTKTRPTSRPDHLLADVPDAELARQWKAVKREYPAVAAFHMHLTAAMIRVKDEYRDLIGSSLIGRAGELDPAWSIVNPPPIDCKLARNEADLDRYFDCLEKRIAQATP